MTVNAKAHDPVDALDVANKSYVDAKAAGAAPPIGAVMMWPKASGLPTSYLYAQGQAVSRTTYAALFGVYGTTFGAGDGSTTFNLPNFNDHVPVGAFTQAVGDKTFSETGQQLAYHAHSFGTGVTTPNESNNHDHGNVTNGAGTTAGQSASHNHVLQGIVTTVEATLHTHNVNIGAMTLRAIGVYFAIRAL